MSHVMGIRPFRKRQFRTLSLLCDDEPLSDIQIKSYQAKLQEYQNFLDSVVRLALCGNVCVTEEAVTIGEHGLLTGEALNALQHAGAISVYNTLQQNNWEFPVPEEGEVAVIKNHIPVPDEFLDSETPVRSDWPAVHISECFIEGEKAKLHGSVRPLRTFLPPTVTFRNAADVDDDIPESELNVSTISGIDSSVEIVPTEQGIAVKRTGKANGESEFIPLDEYFFGREEGNKEYVETKGDFRFKCAVCQQIFHSNIKLMSHILGHVDEKSQVGLLVADPTHCPICKLDFPSAFDRQNHMDQAHPCLSTDSPSDAPLELNETHGVSTPSERLVINQSTAFSQTTGHLNCRICGKESCDEFDLAQHLHSTHRQREMPYVCRLCLFRSSLFEDILDHFKRVHDNSNHLLCTYCLRIFTPSDARSPHPSAPGLLPPPSLGCGVGQTQVYLQHLRMHQVQHQLRRCPSCKLNFTNKSDYQIHRRLDHKGTRTDAADRLDDSQNDDTYESADFVDPSTQHLKETQPRITLMNAPDSNRTKILSSVNLPENIDEMSCLECDQTLGSSSHMRYLPCSICRFGTFCASGYSRHLSQGHVYVSGTPITEPDMSSPLVRPVYFNWMAEEVRLLKNQIHLEQNSGVDMSRVVSYSNPEENSASTTLLQDDSAQILHNTQAMTHTVSSEETNSASLLSTSVYRPGPDIRCSPLNSVQPAVTSSSNMESAGKMIVNEPDVTDLFSAPDVADVPQNKPQDTVNSHPLQSSSVSVNRSNDMNADTDIRFVSNEASPWDIVVAYMSTRLDARRLACMHCAATNLNGNSLARHLFEECGTSTATLNPNPALVKAREQLGEKYRIHQDLQMTEHSETDILFESTEFAHPSASVTASYQNASDSDIVMVNAASDQFPSYTLVETQPEQSQLAVENQMITQLNAAGGTTIDITDATGQVVQQFIIPDDLQLEEGQTLVVIHDENGQPQLAIVNEADLIDSTNSSMLIQSEDPGGNLLLYSNASEEQAQPTDDITTERDDEKENRQFTV